MTRSKAILWAALSISWPAAVAEAAPPELKYFTPPGAQRGTTTDVTAVGKFDAWPVRGWVSGQGVTLEPAKDKGKFKLVVAADAASGPRWVRVTNDDGASAARPIIIGALREVAEKEPNDDDVKAQDVGSETVTVNGALEKAGDVDSYRVTLAEGESFVAAIDANERLGAPVDAVLQIVQDGFVLAQSHDDRGLDPRIVWTAPKNGNYFVRVFGFAADPNSSIRYHGSADSLYRLTLTTGPLVEQAVPTAAAVDSKTDVALESASGRAVGKATLQASPLVGPIALPVPAGLAGDAVAEVVDVPTAMENSPTTKEAPQRIELPVALTGRINEAGDRDAYVIAAKKGETWRIRARSASLGFAADPLLIVEGPDGKQLLRVDDVGRGNADVDTVLKPQADGDYKLIVEDLFGGASVRHLYLLDVRQPDRDFTLTLAAGEFTTAVGTGLEIPVTIERPSGMTADIEVRIDGLPKSIPAVKAVSNGKGDTAKKVVLKVKSDKPFSGPIRIVGEAKASAVVKRVAAATVAGVPRSRVEEAWLTVTQAKKK